MRTRNISIVYRLLAVVLLAALLLAPAPGAVVAQGPVGDAGGVSETVAPAQEEKPAAEGQKEGDIDRTVQCVPLTEKERDEYTDLIHQKKTGTLTDAGNSRLTELDYRSACIQPNAPQLAPESGDGGWTHLPYSGTIDEWEWGRPTHTYLQSCNNGSTNGCWVTDLDDNYDSSSSQDLLSPTTSTSGYSGTIYVSWFDAGDIESGCGSYDWDWGRVYASCNGGDFIAVAPRECGTWAWTQRAYSTGCTAGQTVQLDFWFKADSSLVYDGWFIDDVRIYDANNTTIYSENFEPVVSNTAPTVNAGTDQTIHCAQAMALSGEITDDGLPTTPGALYSTWTRISGPSVTFGAPTQTVANSGTMPKAHATTVNYGGALGVYVFQLDATDGALSATADQVQVNVSNGAPTVNAGTDQTVTTLPVSLDGTVSDDGCGALTTTWSKVSGPGTATFGSAGAVDTTASFSTYGTYVLKLTAFDGTATVEDEVTIIYRDPAAANPAPVQIYYVTVPEYDGLVALDTINGAAGRPVYTYFSIAVATAGTYVYYDQWENGYAADIANPTTAEIYNAATNPGGVQIWGNGVCADGYPPNKRGIAAPSPCTAAWDGFIAGDVVIPDNAVNMDFTPSANYNYDTFSVQGYSNSNGSQAWESGWAEANTGENSATSGLIQVTAGGLLSFQATEAGDWIWRQPSTPTGNVCAELSFDLSHNGQVEFDDSDRLALVGQDSSGIPSWASWHLMGVNGVDPSGHHVVDLPHFTNNPQVGFVSNDALEPGEAWYVDNVRVEWGPCSRNQSQFYYDGRDKVGATGSISMARAFWANGSETLNAMGHEMYPTAEWGTEYQAPVGCDITNAGEMFEYSALSIMAAIPGTVVQISYDANDSFEQTVTLNEGEATLAGYYVTSGCTYVHQGARVVASEPVQVQLLTGDIASGYASRDMSLLPVSQFGTTAWSPVGCGLGDDNWSGAAVGATRLFLYNPRGNATTYICCNTYALGTLSAGSIAARSTGYVDLDLGSGARCFTADSSACTTATNLPLFGIGAYDQQNIGGDWSFTLFPGAFLSTDALVGLGLGRDPTYAGTASENGSPLWVTAACDSGSTYVYADWNNDGAAEPIDTNGDGTAEAGSQNGISIASMQSVRFYDPSTADNPYDQSGARIWSCATANTPNRADCATAGCNIALAWGQDALRSTPGSPGLDVGTSIAPLRLIEVSKGLSLATGGDLDLDGQLSPGDTATYLITFKNIGASTVDNIVLTDDPFTTGSMTYVPNSTASSLDGGVTWTPVSDDPSGTAFPLDGTGTSLPAVAARSNGLLRFNVQLEATGDLYTQVTNCANISSAAGSRAPCTTNQVASRDWGDLPDTYGTSLTANGPRHSPSSLQLGNNFDKELQGAPAADAKGDDSYETTLPKGDDEDGVTLAGTQADWNAGSGAFTVVVTAPGCTTNCGCLNAWMDFTNDSASGAGTTYADGNFRWTSNPATYDSYSGKSEWIVQNAAVNNGSNTVMVSLPTGLNAGVSNPYYFRFRLSPLPCGSITPTGLVAGGEVEDYRFDLINAPTAVDLLNLGATVQGEAIEVAWDTVNEVDHLGFNLYRAADAAGPGVKLNAGLIPAQGVGSPLGFHYSYLDATELVPGTTYTYWLEDVSTTGVATRHAPVSVLFGSEPNAVRMTGFGAAAGAAWPAVGLLLAAVGAAAAARRRKDEG